MKINSLALQTDLMFFRHDAKVIEKEGYLMVITPDNLNFHWGNLLIYPKGPTKEDYITWISDFKRNFKKYNLKHTTFTWDNVDQPNLDYSLFLEAGFKLNETIGLVAEKIDIQHRNTLTQINIAETDKEWQLIKDFQLLFNEENYEVKEYTEFIDKRFNQYRRISEFGLGYWYYATIDGEIVSDLGLFYENGIARFQSIKTHPNYRRQGVAQTLMHAASINSSNIRYFVIEADDEGPAINMYKSIGFLVREKVAGLSKVKNNN